MRESLCHNAQWLRAMHITFVVAFAFLPLLSSLPSFHPFFLPLLLPVVVLNSDSSSFSRSSCSRGHTIPIRAGVLTSLCTARLPLSCPKDKGSEKQPSRAQHALIRRSRSISKIARVYRTCIARLAAVYSPLCLLTYVVLLYGTLSISSGHTRSILLQKLLPSAQPAFCVLMQLLRTTHARLITLRTFASLYFLLSFYLFLSAKFSRKDYGSVSTGSQRRGERKTSGRKQNG